MHAAWTSQTFAKVVKFFATFDLNAIAVDHDALLLPDVQTFTTINYVWRRILYELVSERIDYLINNADLPLDEAAEARWNALIDDLWG